MCTLKDCEKQILVSLSNNLHSNLNSNNRNSEENNSTSAATTTTAALQQSGVDAAPLSGGSVNVTRSCSDERCLLKRNNEQMTNNLYLQTKEQNNLIFDSSCEKDGALVAKGAEGEEEVEESTEFDDDEEDDDDDSETGEEGEEEDEYDDEDDEYDEEEGRKGEWLCSSEAVCVRPSLSLFLSPWSTFP